MKRLLVVVLGVILLVGCGSQNEPEAIEDEYEYELIEPEAYRVLAPSVDTLIDKYNDIRKLEPRLPKIENKRSDDGHIRGTTFDENSTLSFYVNVDDTVNSIHYMGDDVLILNTMLQLLDIDEHDVEVRQLLTDAGKAYRDEETYTGEIVYEGVKLKYSKGMKSVFLDVYGVE